VEKTEIINTKYGKIQGYIQKGIKIFKGIPYAAPPMNELRFMPPKPPAAWSDILITTEFGPNVPQPENIASFLFGPPREESEDNCLTLNIWTPGTDKKRRPVMFWIHGGNFRYGSSAQVTYTGIPLAKRGNIVLVTINYRLGPLGFLYIPDKTVNVGMLDQVAALKWVHDNIEAFGGDPDNITIFGESAGATSVITLLAMPMAKGLFHRAIAQSTSFYFASHQESGSKKLISRLGIEQGDIESLQKIDINKMNRIHRKMALEAYSTQETTPFSPVVDGKILPEDPLKAIKKGYAANIPLLIGTTQEEMKFYHAFLPSLPEFNSEKLFNRIKRIVNELGHNEDKAKKLIANYIEAREGKFSTDPQEILDAILTDVTFRIITIRIAEAQGKHQPNTYTYMFTWPSPMMGGKLGACHAVDVAFTFGTLYIPGTEKYCGKGKDADILSEKIMDSWITFARSGNPNNENIPDWPAYDANKRATMLLGKEIKVVNAPFDKERAAWDDII
jgi:para-nitrobenzyl esterase